MPEPTPLDDFFAALRRHDMAAAAAYVAPDVRVSGMTLLPLRGRSAWQQYVQSFWTAFPDLTTDILATQVEPGRVLLTERIQGTHLGPLVIPPLAPVPPTGRRIHVGPNHFTFHVRDGVVARMEARMQRWQFLRQMGLWPFVLAVLRTPFTRQ